MQNPVFARDNSFQTVGARPAYGQTATQPPAQQAYGATPYSPAPGSLTQQPGLPLGGPGFGMGTTMPPVDIGQLNASWAGPTAGPVDMNRVSYEDVIVKTFGLLALVVTAGAVTWMTKPGMWMVAAPIGLVLAMVNIFRKKISPALIMAYAVVMGVFVGGVSRQYEAMVDGVVLQAVGATLAVFVATLALFASGKVRASGRITKVFLVALVGYVLFSLINAVLVWTGQLQGFGVWEYKIFGLPAALVFGVIVVLLGSYSFVLDFESIKKAVEQGAPPVVAWRAGFGLLVTIIWLYLELLRIIAILTRR